jgi:uncharacterized tellurite resistance protein B-like protein
MRHERCIRGTRQQFINHAGVRLTLSHAVPEMSLVTRLIDLVAGAIEPKDNPAAEADRNMAVAALLVHVARVDGLLADAERLRVLDLLQGRLGLSAERASWLFERGNRLDREVDDVAALIDMMGHGVPLDERRRLVGMAYAVAGADGRIEEFEDDLVWRMAGLLGFKDADIQAIKQEALASLGLAPQAGTLAES